MERMGDILARTAASRARQARRNAGAATTPGAAPSGASAPTPSQPGAPSSAHAPTPIRAGQRSRVAPVRGRAPLRALSGRAMSTVPAARVTRPATPPAPADLLETPPGAAGSARAARVVAADVVGLGGADARDVDRILELPARRDADRAIAGGAPGGGRSRAADVGEVPPRKTARLREAASAYAAQASDPTFCPRCGGAGYLRVDLPVGDPLFGRPVPCECKERQMEERRRTELLQISSFQPFNDKTFENFDPAVQGVHEAFEVARAYAADPRGWLVISGPYGVGKTHLAAAIATEHLAQGNTTIFSIVPDLLDHLRAAFGPTSELPYDALFDRIREAGLVVLDDLGSENGTAWATEKLFQLINHRYNLGYPTVITTNDRLLSHMDDRIRSRLSDISLVRHISIKAQDYRQRYLAGRRGGSGAAGAAGKVPGSAGAGVRR